MKTRKPLSLLLMLILLSSCGNSGESNYVDKSVNIYRKPNVVSKSISLRFYASHPHVPYISVSEYFKEFYNENLFLMQSGSNYKYMLGPSHYLGFNAKQNHFYTKGLYTFNNHPDSKSSTGKTFLKEDKLEHTTPKEAYYNLNNYSISIYEDGDDAYVPLSLLSRLSGGLSQFDVAYNGKDIYFIDRGGQLGDKTNTSIYGEGYFSILNDKEAQRYSDLASYTYNELCFVFDNLRGYTEHLVFGDNNLLSLGLNGILENYAPEVKEYLLSTDKISYLEGLSALFNGLYDNGHTSLISNFSALTEAMNKKSEQVFTDLSGQVDERIIKTRAAQGGVVLSRTLKFGQGTGNNYYHFDSTTKTSYIIFNKFAVDYDGWNNYYNGKGEVPVSTDSYAFVRSKLYQAKQDQAENVVIDLSANGGGDSWALEGIVGLLNGAKSDFHMFDTVNKYMITEKHSIDINLDGKWDEEDINAANELKFNIGVMTSPYSFSCGNLLPSTLKQLGYKIIGDKSGGGSCAVSIETTADGIEYARSSYRCLSDAKGNNIDSGVDVDFYIEHPTSTTVAGADNYDSYYNFELVSDYLTHAYE